MQVADVIDPQFHLIEDERARREAWMRAIGAVFMPTLDRSAPMPRDVAFRCWRVGPTLTSSIKASPQTIERTRSQIAVQAVDVVILRLYLSGRSSVEGPSGDVEVPAGSMVLYDLAQRSQSVSKGMTGVNLAIPRRMFDRRVGEVGDLHNALLRPHGSPLVRLLADHASNLRHCLDDVDQSQKELLGAATVSICNAALTAASDSAHNAAAVAAIEVRQFVEANLGHPGLGVEMLCARFGLSRTPLYAMFEAEGGVATYIRNRRLARAMRLLSGAEGGASRRVSEVAHACGYGNAKAFSKAFQSRYGVVPREVDASFRSEARREAGSTLLSWIREL